MLFSISGWSQDYGYTEENGILYKVDYEKRTATVVRIEENFTNTDIEIPSTIMDYYNDYTRGCKVVAIDDHANFGSYTGEVFPKSVHLPETITYIGGNINWGGAKINIPSSIKYIGEKAFGADDDRKQAKIITENIVLPNVEYIGDYAFQFQHNIKSIDLSETKLDTIHERTFGDCENLHTIDLPNTVKCFCDWAFAFTDIRELKITENIDSIGDNVFVGDTLLNLRIDYNNKSFALYDTGLYNYNLSKLLWYGWGNSSGQATLPSTTTEIRPRAFAFNPYIKKVYAPNVKIIGEYAFSFCISLETLKFPNVEQVKHGGLSCCAKEIVISESLKEISDEMFYCGYSGYYYHEQMESFVCPPNVERIGRLAFGENIQLTTVTLPQKLRKIGYCAFYFTGLLNIDIPSNVEYIEGGAFCLTHLEKVTVRSTIPPICGIENGFHVFENKNGGSDWYDFVEKYYYGIKIYKTVYYHNTYENATLYVPKESLELYKTTYPWSEFKKIRYIGQPEPYVLNDGEAYAETETSEKEELEYHRTFNNTNWQALYVPFSMSYDDWKDEFEVGKINDVNMYDTDDDGEFDVTEVELLKIKRGSIEANTPYFIKAKATGDKVIHLENATLYPAEENYVDCSSTEMRFIFQGTYSGVSGEDMYENKHYALASGSLCYAQDATVSLKPMRWYMKSEARNNRRSALTNNVRLRVVGENATEIADVKADKKVSMTYALDGRVVNANNLKKGMYIKDGKKIIIR